MFLKKLKLLQYGMFNTNFTLSIWFTMYLNFVPSYTIKYNSIQYNIKKYNFSDAFFLFLS